MRITNSKADEAGFTLVELLVVISVISILLAVTVPFLSKMVETTNLSMARDLISANVGATRVYATKNKFFLKDLRPTVPGDQNSETLADGYSGAAVIFTPQGELRVVENDEDSRDSSGDYLEIPTTGGLPARNGYKDVDTIDYVRLPAKIGVFGIYRKEAELWLIPPPFAISFDQNGALVLRRKRTHDKQKTEGWVYYDGDGSGRIDAGSAAKARDNTGGSSYNPMAYSSQQSPRLTDGRFELPLEKIEPVMAVIVYLESDFVAAGFSNTDDGPIKVPDTGAKPASAEWLFKHGEMLQFSRYTGSEAGE